MSVTVRQKSLVVSLEQEATLDRWTGSFSAETVEYITQKSGVARRLSTFAQMLLRAMEAPGEGEERQLGLQVLTQEQLSRISKSENDNRLFLVLQFKNDFENVFYPLPLDRVAYNLTDGSNEAYLMSAYKQTRAELAALRRENETLREAGAGPAEPRECQNCAFLDQQLKNTVAQLDYAVADKEEAIEAVQLAVKSKEKYKARFKEAQAQISELEAKLAARDEKIKDLKQRLK